MRPTFAMMLALASALPPTHGDVPPKPVPVAAAQPEKVPKEIQDAARVLTKWLDGLEGQTFPQIRKALGDPAEETTWEYKGKKEPLLTYKIGDGTKLTVYFHEGKVIQASLLLLP